MNKSRDTKPAPVDRHAPVETESMSAVKRWTLIGVAVFCLLIFSVTGPMTDVIGSWVGQGPMTYATVELPSGGTKSLSENDYRNAIFTWEFAEEFGMGIYDDDSTEEMLAYATLMLLADDYGVAVTQGELMEAIRPLHNGNRAIYESVWRRYARRAQDFEANFARALRVWKMSNLLQSVAVPDENDVLSSWSDAYAEMRVQFVAWKTEDFEEAAAALVPDEGVLETYFDEELTPLQRRDLETEEAYAFELAVLNASAMSAGAYDEWADLTEPTEEAMQNFYQANVYSLYQRSEEELEENSELSVTLTREEVGDDRLHSDYLLQRAVLQLGGELMDVEADGLAAHLASRGAELRAFADPVKRSELAGLEEVGTMSLGQLSQGETGVWQQRAILTDGGLGYLMRPTERVDRQLPPLEEIREDVLALWREMRQSELAKEAADAFAEALPKPEDYIEGDAIVLDQAGFAAAVDGTPTLLEWVPRRFRPTTDPIWDPAGIDAAVRNQAGILLDELVDGQVMETMDLGRNGFAVVQIIERRPADAETMWPGELQQARRAAASFMSRTFFADQLSFEAMGRLYGLAKSDELLDRSGS